MLRLVVLVTCSMALAAAQAPLIYTRSVFNAASYVPAGVPGGAIARGAIFSVFGARLGPAQAVSASAYPLGTTLGGVSITVSQNGSSVNAIPIFANANQVNAIMPSNAPLGAASVQISFNNARSNMAPVRIAGSAFGIFTVSGAGYGPAVVQNFVSTDNQPVNAPTVTAQRGQAVTLWGTGLGAAKGADNVAPAAGSLSTPVEVYVGGAKANVAYSGRAPCCAGTDQIVFNVPDNAPSGCWVPVYVRTDGSALSNAATMAIQPSGGVCAAEVLPAIAARAVNGGRLGGSMLLRATTRHDAGTRAPIEVTSDYHASFGMNFNGGPFPFNPAFGLPPPGTCTFYTATGDMLNGGALLGAIPPGKPLDFGAPFVVTGPRGTKTLTTSAAAFRSGAIGASITPNLLQSSLFLEPGHYDLRGLGGIDIGAFTQSFDVPQPLTWVNRDQLTLVDRTQPLTISWTGGDAGQIVGVAGFSEDLPANSSAVFACLASAGASSLTVPAIAMTNLPATRSNPLRSKSVIYLVTVPGSSTQVLNANGLDDGLSFFSFINGKSVIFQ